MVIDGGIGMALTHNAGTTYLKKPEGVSQTETTELRDRVGTIIHEVARDGDEALKRFLRQFDAVELTSVEVMPGEIEAARRTCDTQLLEDMKFGIARRFSVAVDRTIVCSRTHRPGAPETHDMNMADAEHAMPEPNLLDPALQEVCRILLTVGAGVFGLGLYLGFVRHANSALVFSLLGVTTGVFAVVLFVLLKPSKFASMGAAKSKSQPHSDTASIPDVGPEAHPVPAAIPQPEITGGPPVEPTTQISHAAAIEPKLAANIDLASLMNTTVGDILLAVLRKDPEGAGRIFTRALTQAPTRQGRPTGWRNPRVRLLAESLRLRCSNVSQWP
jgi:hypothetical protein